MAASGFEGFEKRLELHFRGSSDTLVLGLRGIDFLRLRAVLDEVQCSVVSAVGNESFDAYVLSESSLFVSRDKIIIKTCGTTQLLRSVPGILSGAVELGMAAVGCRYTRGSFIFPDAQPLPHTSFEQVVEYLERSLPGHPRRKKACVLKPPPIASHSHAWHVFTATASGYRPDRRRSKSFLTMEICMTKLDRAHAEKFFRRDGDRSSGDALGKAMTAATGVGDILPAAIVCDYAFDPCGYSMNGVVDGDRYSTVHVTPEEGFSYASFECIAPADVGGGGGGGGGGEEGDEGVPAGVHDCGTHGGRRLWRPTRDGHRRGCGVGGCGDGEWGVLGGGVPRCRDDCVSDFRVVDGHR